jgi:hypothetical protein
MLIREDLAKPEASETNLIQTISKPKQNSDALVPFPSNRATLANKELDLDDRILRIPELAISHLSRECLL